MSWALIAKSAIKGGGDGVLAASKDINTIIESCRIDDLLIFPSEATPAGFYAWNGDVTDRGECGVDAHGALRRVTRPEEVTYYILMNGRELP